MKGVRLAALMAALTLLIAVIPTAAAQPEQATLTIQEGYQTVAENQAFILSADTKNGFISLTDKKGIEWFSVPNGYTGDSQAQNITKIAMESLLQISYSDKQRNIKPLNAKSAAVNKGGLKSSAIKNGVRLTYTFEKEGFTIPVELTLGEDYLDAAIVTEEIVESIPEYKLMTISLLPYFAAAGSSAEGYIFVPDGCGALIELNHENRYIEDYSQYVYGREPAVSKPQQEALSATIRMPVFGIKNGENAMMGIITEGAGRSLINASVNGKRCSYNNVFAEFIYRDSELVKIEQKGETVRVIEQDPPKSQKYAVRYYFLKGEKANYVGMAERFGDWLLGDKKSTSGATFFAEIIGGAMVKDQVFGFPIERVAPLTTYSQTQEIVSQLKDFGVDDLAVYLNCWQKGGTEAAISKDVSAEPKLGGTRGLKKMLKNFNEQKLDVFLEFNLTEMLKSSWGYSARTDSVMSIQKSPAMLYSYSLNTLKANLEKPVFMLNLNKSEKAAISIEKSHKKYNFTGVSASSLGNTLYSDFSGKTYKRDSADKKAAEILAKTQKIKGQQLLSKPNAFALPFTDVAVDTPVYSSGYLVETHTVPFYQIALHGKIAMSTPDINRMSDPEEGLLKALESGIGVKYRFTMDTSERLSKNANSQLNGTLFSL
ncbi:MAG: DUF5696 domain-containing protein, partial [Oscillospiraceae bacterium]